MNKKGFTLVELLAVIVILGLLVVIAVPSVNAVNQKTKQKMLKTKAELAQQNLILWAQDNKKCFMNNANTDGIDCVKMTYVSSTTSDKTFRTTYKNLADFGIIDYDNGTNVISPVDKSNVNNKTITIKYKINTKTFEVTNNQLLPN